MKKIFCLITVLMFLIPLNCKKDGGSGSETTLAQKYAKYKVLVYKDKELKTRLAALEKAEDVNLLAEEKFTDSLGKTTDISKVKLADDSIGYIAPKHLADAPIVFTSDTKAFVRPTAGSSIYTEIPKGELGFIIGEKGLWVQVYVGKINNKYVTQQWVEGGYSNDPGLVLEAKRYASAVDALNGKDEEKAEQAKATLQELAEGTSIIAELARKKQGITEDEESQSDEGLDENEEDSGETTEKAQ